MQDQSRACNVIAGSQRINNLLNVAYALRTFRAACPADDTQPILLLILARSELLLYTLAGTSPQGRSPNSSRCKMPRDPVVSNGHVRPVASGALAACCQHRLNLRWAS